MAVALDLIDTDTCAPCLETESECALPGNTRILTRDRSGSFPRPRVADPLSLAPQGQPAGAK